MTELKGEHQEHGVQVVLSREASAAARGAVADSIQGNIEAKRKLEVSGEQADGQSTDGTSVTGKRQRDDVMAEKTDDPAGPPTGVKPAEGVTVFDAAGAHGTTHTPTPDGEGGPANAKPTPKAEAAPPPPAPAPAPAPAQPAKPAG